MPQRSGRACVLRRESTAGHGTLGRRNARVWRLLRACVSLARAWWRGGAQSVRAGAAEGLPAPALPVSYTHLTLPTKRIV